MLVFINFPIETAKAQKTRLKYKDYQLSSSKIPPHASPKNKERLRQKLSPQAWWAQQDSNL